MISTHVLDLVAGKPAAGIEVKLLQLSSGAQWIAVGSAVTDQDGRIGVFGGLVGREHRPGTYQLVFAVQEYLEKCNRPVFFPTLTLSFLVSGAKEHYHVPVLLSNFGYSTYRGS